MTQRFLLIGDVAGAETYHVGDEGMLEANLESLRELAPQAEFTVISRDPEWTAQTYGTTAIEPIGFTETDLDSKEAEDRLESLLEAVSQGELPAGFDRGPQALAVIDAIRSADALVISGGGNMNATWPEHLYERVALLALAERLDKPAVVLGQTIGPRLSEMQSERLVESLRAVRLIGVRESDSYDLLEKLGVSAEILDYQLDDAIFLGKGQAKAAPRPELERPYLALTLCGELDGLKSLASQIESLAGIIGADIVFVPHAGEPDFDRDVGARFGEALQAETRFHLLEVLPAREVAAITGAAELVISTRYHPVVFASAGGVPSLGLSVDQYTRQKLSGALAHAGLGNWVLPIELGVGGLLLPAGRELWARRDEVRGQLTEQLPRWETLHENHWRRVARALDLGGEQAGESHVSSPKEVTNIEPEGDWHRAAIVYSRIEALYRSEGAERGQHSEALKRVLASRDEEIASQKPVLARYEAEVASMEQALDAGRRNHSALKKEIEASQEILRARDEQLGSLKPIVAGHEEELTSLRSTLEAKEEELTSLRSNLEAKEEELTSLKPTLAAKEEELASIKPVLAARDEEVVNLGAELESMQSALSRCESKLDAYRNSFAGKLARKLGMSPERDDEETS